MCVRALQTTTIPFYFLVLQVVACFMFNTVKLQGHIREGGRGCKKDHQTKLAAHDTHHSTSKEDLEGKEMKLNELGRLKFKNQISWIFCPTADSRVKTKITLGFSAEIWLAVMRVSRWTSVWFYLSSPFSSKGVIHRHYLSVRLRLCSSTMKAILKWLITLPILMQESLQWRQCIVCGSSSLLTPSGILVPANISPETAWNMCNERTRTGDLN